MRVSIIISHLSGWDATGRCIINQTRYFQQAGAEVRIFGMVPPHGLPDDLHQFVRTVSLAELLSDRSRYFGSSDLYIYHYPGRYALLESIREIAHGIVLLHFHNVTPPNLWRTNIGREWLDDGIAGIYEFAHYADLIVADSPFNEADLITHYHYPPHRIRVQPLAVPLDAFAPGPKSPELLQQYGLADRPVILFVGRMAGNKRVDLLIEALPQVQQAVPKATLLLVGDDGSNPAFLDIVAQAKRQAEELGVAEDVIFTGMVDDLPPYYRLADVYATASLHEGFGVPLIEAMASGLPIVASRATAHPWVLGQAGLLVEPENVADLAASITRVLTDQALTTDLVQRGRARAEMFSLTQWEINWHNIVTEAMNSLPEQPFLRPQSLLAQRVTGGQDNTGVRPTIREVLLQGKLERLMGNADIMDRDYKLVSHLPLIGGLIARIRETLTSHLWKPYIDPTFARQSDYNRQTARMMAQVIDYLLAQLAQSDKERREMVYIGNKCWRNAWTH